jgi:hypothetical protein
MSVPLWLGVPALVIVLLMVAWCALILAGRNPLPFPDVGSRIFSAASPAAKATILEPGLPIAFVVSNVFAGTVLNFRST